MQPPPHRDAPAADALGFYRWLRDTAESPLHRGALYALLPDRMPLGTLEDDLHTLRRQLVCRWCRRAFRMCDSIGQWRCSFHPGGLCAGEYTCCGAAAGGGSGGDGGCTPCDHESDVDPAALRARDHAEGRTLTAMHAARAALRRRRQHAEGHHDERGDGDDDGAPLDERSYAAAMRNLAAREAHLSLNAAAAALALPPTAAAAAGTVIQRAGPGTLLLRTPQADGRIVTEAYFAPDELRAGDGPSGELQRARSDVLRGASLTLHASAARIHVPLYLLLARALEWPREDAIADYMPAARTDGRPGVCALRSRIVVHTRAPLSPAVRRR